MRRLVLIISLYLTFSNAMFVCEVSYHHNYDIPKTLISNHLKSIYGRLFFDEYIGEINICEVINHDEYKVRYILRNKIDLYIKFFESEDMSDGTFYLIHYTIGLAFSNRYISNRDIEKETGCKMTPYTSDHNYICQKLYAKKWADSVI